MKVAIPLYRGRVAPRLAFAKEALIATVRGGKVLEKEQIDLSSLSPLEIPRALAEQGVTVLIGGGIEPLLGRMLRAHNIEVIWGIIGEVDDVLSLYLSNGLRVGMGPCPKGRRRWRRPP